jgi:hypothetical protein
MRRIRFAVTSLAVGAILFAGSFGFAVAQEDDAQVRIVHASPDAPAVDIFVNGDRAIENLAFGEATDLIPLPAGEYDVAVAPAGAAIDDAVIEATLPLAAGAAYEVAATGTIADGTLAPQVYPLDLSPIEEGKARVRVVHNSPDAPAVDVAVADGPVLFSNIAFPDATDFAEVDAGTYDLEVRPAGTDDVALALDGVALEAGTVYDVFAIGALADGTLQALPLTATASGVGAALPSAPEAQGTMQAAGEPVHTMPHTGVGAGLVGIDAAWLAALAALAAAIMAILASRLRFASQ